MKHAIKAIALSAFAFVLTAAVPAFASPASYNFSSGPNWGVGLHMLLKTVSLTTDQNNQVQLVLAAAHSQEKALRTQAQAIHEQIADKLLGNGSPSAADFSALMAQETQIHGQMSNLALKTALQIRSLLNSTQIAHITQIHQQMQSLDAQRRALIPADDAANVAPEAVGVTPEEEVK